mgnify:CR=1 FL=1
MYIEKYVFKEGKMKKFLKVVGGIFCALMMFGCSDLVELNSGSDDENFGTLYFDSKSRFVDVYEISNATVNVYGYGMSTISKSGVSITGGKGTLSVENIPVGKNRVIEVCGYKIAGVPVKILYAVTDINSGANSVGTIKDGSDSAKGKAYLALLNAGVDISSVSLGGFDGVSSAYLFDADGFAKAYKNDSSVLTSDFIQKTGTVKFTNIKSASGYSVWIDDPLSEKLSIDSDSTTTASLTGVAPGSWKVYVNDGNATKTVGTVTVPSVGSADFDTLIGNALAGKTVIFVKCAANTNLYAWTTPSKIELCGAWSGTTLTTNATSDYMNDPSGWYMIDVTEKYGSSKEAINIILIPAGGSQSSDLDSKIAGTFWYDGSKFYDSDPTTAPTLDSDATLKEIKVNGVSIGLEEEYEVPAETEKVTVTAVANSSKATVSVSPSGETSLVAGEPKSFSITVTAEDGTVKSYSLSVTRKAESPNDVTLSSIRVNGSSIGSLSGTSFKKSLSGSDDSCSVTVTAVANASSAKVSVSPESATIADGKSTEFIITVKNGSASATYTLTVDYTKAEGSEYYWTNKNGYGTNKTISSWSDWTEAERIAQCAAYDDPRTWTGLQEVPYDVYALYAAYDDTNLYVMVELTNMVDRAKFMFHNFASSDNAWWNNRDIPLGLAINTGASVLAKGSYLDAAGTRVWGTANDGIAFEDANGFDWLLYHSSKYGTFDGTFIGVGTPGFFHVQSDGYFSYNTTTDTSRCLSLNSGTTTGTSGIDIKYKRQCVVSKQIYYESTPTDNRKTSAQTGEMLMASDNYTAVETNDLDMSYWYTIPLKILGMTKADVESRGIGIRQLTTGGGSLMDCAPWDPCMVDVAGELYSGADDNTSKEKEDCDKMTTPQARIGHM